MYKKLLKVFSEIRMTIIVEGGMELKLINPNVPDEMITISYPKDLVDGHFQACILLMEDWLEASNHSLHSWHEIAYSIILQTDSMKNKELIKGIFEILNNELYAVAIDDYKYTCEDFTRDIAHLLMITFD